MKKEEAIRIATGKGPEGAKARLSPHNPNDYHIVIGQWQAGTAATSTEDNWTVLALHKNLIEFDESGLAKCCGGSLVMSEPDLRFGAHGNTHQFDHETDGRVWYWDAD